MYTTSYEVTIQLHVVQQGIVEECDELKLVLHHAIWLAEKNESSSVLALLDLTRSSVYAKSFKFIFSLQTVQLVALTGGVTTLHKFTYLLLAPPGIDSKLAAHTFSKSSGFRAPYYIRLCYTVAERRRRRGRVRFWFIGLRRKRLLVTTKPANLITNLW